MRAKTINEVNKFKRGLDPKVAMGTGQSVLKDRLIKLMANPNNFPSDDDRKRNYKYMNELINSSLITVKFVNDNEINITLPPSPLNIFFFDELDKNLAWNNETECHCWDNPNNNTMNVKIFL